MYLYIDSEFRIALIKSSHLTVSFFFASRYIYLYISEPYDL
jgi:hypothetical protein